MLRIEMYITIKTLMKQGKNKSQIAELTGHDWKTVDKVMKTIESGKEYPEKKQHPRLLDSYKDQIISWLEQGLSGVRIKEELERIGKKIGRSTVGDYIQLIKKNRNIFVRIHTKPGEEAQVDFGYAGYTLDNNGKRRKTWVFNMRLSYSRLDYYEKVYNQKVETFINCHINAFRYFGGIPQNVKIDNLKAAVLQADFYEPVFQNLYKNFADYYGFNPLPCRIYSPNDKGKVESGIKYVKNNFFKGRRFLNEDDLDRKLRHWLDKKCNTRVHGTTRKIPVQVFKNQEKKCLLKLPLQEFKMAQVGTRKVYHDCHIYVNYNYYSVPFEYIGKEVELEINQDLLRIFYQYQQIAIHPLLKGSGLFSTIESHYPKYKRISDTEYQEKYQVKMSGLGVYAEQMFFFILQNQKNYWYKTVQGILSLQKSYPDNIINSACKRALAYGVFQYQIIKNICRNGSYLLPIEFQEETYAYNQN
jgi:transposase